MGGKLAAAKEVENNYSEMKIFRDGKTIDDTGTPRTSGYHLPTLTSVINLGKARAGNDAYRDDCGNEKCDFTPCQRCSINCRSNH